MTPEEGTMGTVRQTVNQHLPVRLGRLQQVTGGNGS